MADGVRRPPVPLWQVGGGLHRVASVAARVGLVTGLVGSLFLLYDPIRHGVLALALFGTVSVALVARSLRRWHLDAAANRGARSDRRRTNLALVDLAFIGLAIAPPIVVPAAAVNVVPTSTTTTTTTTTTPASGMPQPAGGPGGSWKVLFDSEFRGSSLDTSQWSTGWGGAGITKGINNYEVECMDPAQVSVANGELNLTAVAKPETCAGETQPYASGMVNTDGKFTFTYGYVESRIWLPGTSAISDWPAFWANGEKWSTTGEIDVVEGLGGQAQAHFHYLGSFASPAQDGPLMGRGSFTGGWHTFAADWEPGSVTYYYDGVSIGSFTTGITSSPMYLVLDLATTAGNASPGTMRVDYVRVWQH